MIKLEDVCPKPSSKKCINSFLKNKFKLSAKLGKQIWIGEAAQKTSLGLSTTQEIQ